jgi:HD superfamily phosphodiesterase
MKAKLTYWRSNLRDHARSDEHRRQEADESQGEAETAAGEHANAELIRLGNDFEHAIGWSDAIEEGRPAACRAPEEEMRIAKQILERRANTPEGLRVKAKVVATVIYEDEPGIDRRATLALAKDVLASSRSSRL